MYLAASAALLAIAFGKLKFQPSWILLGLATTFASVASLYLLIRVVHPDSIATPRRVSAVILVGTLLWLFAVTVHLVTSPFASATQSQGAVGFGAFLTCAFELVVVNGIFVEETKFAMPLSTVHPAIILLWANPIAGFGVLVLGAGVTVISLSLAFVIRLKRIRTTTKDSAIHTLQAFMKTWANHDPGELEEILSRYSLARPITTRAIKFDLPTTQPALILSEVHPGPFFPVGSYNLPELLFQKFQTRKMTALTMHRPGGHEKNLPSQGECVRYADSMAIFAEGIQTRSFPTTLRGPVLAKVNQFTAACIVLGNQALIMVSSSPLSSDDITSSAEAKLVPLAEQCGLSLSLVDAHNSIGGERTRFEVANYQPWKDLFDRLRREEEHEFNLGFAHSSEVKFEFGPDISDAGLGVLIFQVRDIKWTLVFADSNNAASGAKEIVRQKLESAGFKLIEICTSDSHNLAARGLAIDRGYFALGEATPLADVADAIVKLSHLAESRLSSCRYGIDELVTSVPLFGVKAIEDFASLARRSTAFAKKYVIFAVPLALALLILATIS